VLRTHGSVGCDRRQLIVSDTAGVNSGDLSWRSTNPNAPVGSNCDFDQAHRRGCWRLACDRRVPRFAGWRGKVRPLPTMQCSTYENAAGARIAALGCRTIPASRMDVVRDREGDTAKMIQFLPGAKFPPNPFIHGPRRALSSGLDSFCVSEQTCLHGRVASSTCHFYRAAPFWCLVRLLTGRTIIAASGFGLVVFGDLSDRQFSIAGTSSDEHVTITLCTDRLHRRLSQTRYT